MTPVWSPEAIDDLASLRAYIEEDDPHAAQRIALHIIHNVEVLLSKSPDMGRPGFVVPYRFQGNRIQILRVYRGARRWPERF
jgi:toxin ParE1/3/4